MAFSSWFICIISLSPGGFLVDQWVKRIGQVSGFAVSTSQSRRAEKVNINDFRFRRSFDMMSLTFSDVYVCLFMFVLFVLFCLFLCFWVCFFLTIMLERPQIPSCRALVFSPHVSSPLEASKNFASLDPWLPNSKFWQ